MIKCFFTGKKIRNELVKYEENFPALIELLLKKIELCKSQRLKKTIRQSVRKILATGIKECVKGISCKNVLKEINNSPNTKKNILFIAGEPLFNIVGISIYLRNTGKYKTILILENPWLVNFFKQYFDFVYVYNSYYEVARILLSSKPYMIHVQSSNNYNFLGVMAKCLSATRVTFAFNDIPSIGKDSVDTSEEASDTPHVSRLDFLSEKFLFERADGILLTMNTLAVVKVLSLRYKIIMPLLDFPMYISDEFASYKKKPSHNNNGKIHLVYGGIIAPADAPKGTLGEVQFLNLAKSISSSGLCFHMYTSPHFSPFQIKKMFAEYLQFAAEEPNFTFKRGLPLDKAIEEFSQYDFAVLIGLFDGIEFSKVSYGTCTSSKFFTYLAAGLPIIVSEEYSYLASLVRKYEIGIVINQREIFSLSKIIKKCNHGKLKINVKRAMEDFSMKKHIGRLIEFYKQACNKSTNNVYKEMAVTGTNKN